MPQKDRFQALYSILLTPFLLSLLVLSRPLEAEPTYQFKDLASFAANYEAWSDPKNGFVNAYTDENKNRVMRVLFQSGAYSAGGKKQLCKAHSTGVTAVSNPTVSEGMGYALLLAYAANHEEDFKAFLRYIANEASSGCASLAGSRSNCNSPDPGCSISTRWLMPWMVAGDGNTFWVSNPPGQGGPDANPTSGSASDADMQMAYALTLASVRWPTSTIELKGKRYTYSEVLAEMVQEIALFDFYPIDDLGRQNLYTPGSQWGTTGTQVLFPGYITSAVYNYLDMVSQPPAQTIDTSENYTLIINNRSPVSCDIDFFGSGDFYHTSGSDITNPGMIKSGNTLGGHFSNHDHPATFNRPESGKSGSSWFQFQCGMYSLVGNDAIKKKFSIPDSGSGDTYIPGCSVKFTYDKDRWQKEWVNHSTYEGSVNHYLNDLFCEVDVIGSAVWINIDFPEVKPAYRSTLVNANQKIDHFTQTFPTSLIPNVLQLNNDYVLGSDGDGYKVDIWSRSFSFDAVRYPLWDAAFAAASQQAASTTTHKLINFYDQHLQSHGPYYLVPSNGWDATTGKPVCDANKTTYSRSVEPALMAPLATAAHLTQQSSTYNKLAASLDHYNLQHNNPYAHSGSSEPYFSAAMYLVSQALLLGDGTFNLGTSLPKIRPSLPKPVAFPTVPGGTECQH